MYYPQIKRYLIPALSSVALLWGSVGYAQNARTITVTGRATEGGIESEGHSISMRVTAKAATATLAFATLSDELHGLKKALKDAGADNDDISEGELQMNASYDYSKAGLPPSITGYTLAKQVTIKVEHEADLPKFVDATSQSGISGLNLGAGGGGSKDEAAQDEALERLALKNARDRAEQLAKQIGATLGDVLSVSTVPQAKGDGMASEEEEERHRVATPEKRTLELEVVYALR